MNQLLLITDHVDTKTKELAFKFEPKTQLTTEAQTEGVVICIINQNGKLQVSCALKSQLQNMKIPDSGTPQHQHQNIKYVIFKMYVKPKISDRNAK